MSIKKCREIEKFFGRLKSSLSTEKAKELKGHFFSPSGPFFLPSLSPSEFLYKHPCRCTIFRADIKPEAFRRVSIRTLPLKHLDWLNMGRNSVVGGSVVESMAEGMDFTGLLSVFCLHCSHSVLHRLCLGPSTKPDTNAVG